MKIIKFTPLRRIKKTGKVTVASYMQWRKVKTADYSEFILRLTAPSGFNPKERVYNHKGELLFWYGHKNPESLPKNYPNLKLIQDWIGDDLDGEQWKFSEPIGKGFHYSVRGFDCDGVPVFSHYSQDYLSQHYDDLSKFQILTVGMVVLWYGWFLYQLENSNLKLEKI